MHAVEALVVGVFASAIAVELMAAAEEAMEPLAVVMEASAVVMDAALMEVVDVAAEKGGRVDESCDSRGRVLKRGLIAEVGC